MDLSVSSNKGAFVSLENTAEKNMRTQCVTSQIPALKKSALRDIPNYTKLKKRNVD